MSFDGRLLSGVGVFAAVVETGSFVRTADVVGLTTSGVSRAVGRLEERLGIRLFDRSPRGIRLTDDGRRFYDETVPLIDGIAKAMEVRGGGGPLRGRLRIHADAALSDYLLIPHLSDFIALHPQIDLQLVARDRVTDYACEPCDLAIRLSSGDWPGMEAELLFESELVMCASPLYLSRNGTPRVPEDFAAGHVHLISAAVSAGCTESCFDASTRRVSIEAHRRLSFGSATALLSAIRGHLGIGRVPLFMVKAELTGGTLRRILPEWRMGAAEAWLYRPARRGEGGKVEAFASFLTERASPRQPERVLEPA